MRRAIVLHLFLQYSVLPLQSADMKVVMDGSDWEGKWYARFTVIGATKENTKTKQWLKWNIFFTYERT
jgi:hypothetical protein